MATTLSIPGFVYDPKKQRYFPLSYSSKLKDAHEPLYQTFNTITCEQTVRLKSFAYCCRRMDSNSLLHELRKHSFETLSYEIQNTSEYDSKRLESPKSENHKTLKQRLDVNEMKLNLIDQIVSCLCVTRSHIYFLTLSANSLKKKIHTFQWHSPASLPGSLLGCISPDKTMVAGVATASRHQLHMILMTHNQNYENLLTLPNEYIHHCCLQNTGNLFLAGRSLHLYDPRKHALIWHSKAFQLPTSCAVDSNEAFSQVVSGHKQGVITLWDTRQQKYQQSVCISPDRFGIRKVLLTSNMPELFVSTVNGCLRRYDLRWSLHREPLQVFPTPMPRNSGSQILGEFGYQENLGILYLLPDQSSLHVYDCVSVPYKSRTFALPQSMMDDPSSCSTPFFVPPLSTFGLRMTKTR
jgi:WD40 repeat protein